MRHGFRRLSSGPAIETGLGRTWPPNVSNGDYPSIDVKIGCVLPSDKAVIRSENTGDRSTVRSVNEAAFARPDEADLVERLWSEGVVLVSLVAEVRRQIVGHILFSRMSIDTTRASIPAVALAPMRSYPSISVVPLEDNSFEVAWICCAGRESTLSSFSDTLTIIRALVFPLRRRALLRAHSLPTLSWRWNSSPTLSMGFAAKSGIRLRSASEPTTASLGRKTPYLWKCLGDLNRYRPELNSCHGTALHGIRRSLLPWARRSTPKSRRSRVNIMSIPSRFARCTSDASASCIRRPSYLAKIAAIPGRSVSPKVTSSKGRPWKEDRSFRIARGYARKSHAASVITGQQVSSGPLIRRSCSTHASWCSSDSNRMATIGPVSTSTWPVKSHRIRQNTLGSC